MKRVILAGGLVIAGVLVGCTVLILWATRPRPAPPIEGPGPEPGAAAVAAPASPIAVDAPLREPVAGVAHRRARTQALAHLTGDEAAASRAVRVTVRRGLQAPPVQARLARCVDAADGPAARGRAASVVLELEIGEGAIRIADASILEWGGTSAQAMACARDVLRGQVLSAPEAEGARRVRMPYRLIPRPEIVAAEASPNGRDPARR